MLKKSLTVAGAALALAIAPSASASAAPGFDPSSPKTANPAQTCAFIDYYVDGPSPVGSFSDCVRTAAGAVPSVPGFGSPLAQCEELEQGPEGIRYPYAFYAGLPAGVGFPGLIAHDRQQCARAVWAFHTIASTFGPPPA